MKKICALCAMAMLLTLAGCKDASVAISDSNEAVLTVGNTKITKGEIFSQLKTVGGSTSTLTLINNKLYEAEGITITDEMKAKGDESVATMKESYGEESFLQMLTYYGVSDETAYKEQIVYPSLMDSELLKKYVTDNADDVFSSYNPIKAKVIEAKDQDNANSALQAIQEGKSFEDAATEYGTTTTYKGEETLYHVESGLPTTVLTTMTNVTADGLIQNVIEDTTTSKYYIVEVTNRDSSTFKDEAIEKIASSNSSTLKSTALAYYLKKHDFHIYDIDVYNGVKTSNPTYIVQ